MLPNLFICFTPLQSLIVQQLIRQNAPAPAHLLMICYPEANNIKFRHYYQAAAALCQRADYVVIPHGRWRREWANVHCLSHHTDTEYRTLYAASIDNPCVQYSAGRLRYQRLETFDDGTANLYPGGILYRTPPRSLKRRLLQWAQGIRLHTEDLRRLSSCHHTLYPGLPNIAAPAVPIQLWQHDTPLPPTRNTRRILLGQPLPLPDTAALFERLIADIRPDGYFPHPREDYVLDGVPYIDSPLIFEDYLLQEIQKQPETLFHVYHIVSTAALNVHRFPHTQVHTFRPAHDFFHSGSINYLYDFMGKMGITAAALPPL